MMSNSNEKLNPMASVISQLNMKLKSQQNVLPSKLNFEKKSENSKKFEETKFERDLHYKSNISNTKYQNVNICKIQKEEKNVLKNLKRHN